MADPFSIVAGAVGILDVCTRVFKYCKTIAELSTGIESEIEGLKQEVKSIKDVNEALEGTFLLLGDGTNAADDKKQQGNTEKTTELWQDVKKAREACKEVIEHLRTLLENKFEPLITDIKGNGEAKVKSKLDGLRKARRRYAKSDELDGFRSRLQNHLGTLRTLLVNLNLSYTRRTNGAVKELSNDVQRLGHKLHTQIAALQQSMKQDSTNEDARKLSPISSLLSFNKHFDTPRSVRGEFTGRSTELKELADSVFSDEQDSIQRRFVVQGIGGSGKTELCSKFAEIYQELFWGVFSVDATSAATVKSTYSRIASYDKRELNQAAAKSWLSSSNEPWLLIIENAGDQDKDVDLADLFPTGRRGIVLITTRDPSYRTHGTAGCESLELPVMDATEARELLLKVAHIRDRDSKIQDQANAVCEELGALPLALVLAGKAIKKRLSTLENYPEYFRGILGHLPANTHDDKSLTNAIIAPLDMLFKGLEDGRRIGNLAAQDAVELLKVFSCFSADTIGLDILEKSMMNYQEAQAERRNTARQVGNLWTQVADLHSRMWMALTIPRLSRLVGGLKVLSQTVYEIPSLAKQKLVGPIRLIANYGVLQETPSLLPAALKQNDRVRLQGALSLLIELALITHHEVSDTYSMHPLIHRWSRYRPAITRSSSAGSVAAMDLSEHAVWCQAAAETLACCVQLPPLFDDTEDVGLHLRLIPHIQEVLIRRNDIEERLEKLREDRNSTRPNKWFPLFGKHKFNRTDAHILAKYSKSFLIGGLYTEAEKLQRVVKQFVDDTLGSDHVGQINVSLLLAGSLMLQSRANEAAELQEKALSACRKIYGADHPKTLDVMVQLANSLVHGAHLHAASLLYDEAIDKLKTTKGADHPDTLRAIDSLGSLRMLYQDHQGAEKLHTTAVEGLEDRLGGAHLDTLSAKAHLAMAKRAQGGEDKLNDARELIAFVYEERKHRLGKEHALTLLAICDFARIKAASGDTDEAIEMILTALPIAKRNLGENHLGVLMGRAHLANIYTQIGQYDKAETELLDVIRPEHYRFAARDDGEHTDRIGALWYLQECYVAQGKDRQALDINSDLLDAIERCGGEHRGKDHVMAKRMREKRREIEQTLAIEDLPELSLTDSMSPIMTKSRYAFTATEEA